MTRLPLVLALAALAVAPATASAATVSIEPNAESGGKRILFVAGPGEVNSVNPDLQGSVYTVQDTSDPPLEIKPPCERWTDPHYTPPGAVECPAAGIDALDIRLGAENDYVFVGAISRGNVPAVLAGGPGKDQTTGGDGADRVFGEGGDDTIAGRAGRDQLVGGDGDDRIDAQDDSPGDRVWCGVGFDSVKADAGDLLAADCEELNGTPFSGGESPGDEPVVPPLEQEPSVPTILQEIELTSLDEALAEGLTFRAGCSETCVITSELRVSQKLKRRLGLRSAVVGRASASRAVSRPRRFRVRFGKRARRALRKQSVLSLTLRIEAVDVDGNPFAAETKLRLRRTGGDGGAAR